MDHFGRPEADLIGRPLTLAIVVGLFAYCYLAYPLRSRCCVVTPGAEDSSTHEQTVTSSSSLPPMITLHTIPGQWGLESISPFCMKVEVYLKLTKTSYRAVPGDPRRAPKGKLPFIDEDGTKIADSAAIVRHLESKSKAPLDEGVDPKARAQAHVIARTFEESLYWVNLWARWSQDENFVHIKKQLMEVIPAPLNWFVPGVIRKRVVASAYAQGIGRHTPDEILAVGKADVEAIATLLGDKPFFLGERLTTIDITAYSFIANVLRSPMYPALQDAVKAHKNLTAYVDRVAERVAAAAS